MTEEKRTIYTIKIIYKSGAIHTFDCYKFDVSGTLGADTNYDIQWESVDANNAPLYIGGADIAAVWQVGIREE